MKRAETVSEPTRAGPVGLKRAYERIQEMDERMILTIHDPELLASLRERLPRWRADRASFPTAADTGAWSEIWRLHGEMGHLITLRDPTDEDGLLVEGLEAIMSFTSRERPYESFSCQGGGWKEILAAPPGIGRDA
jgi:hypothetical protein